MSSPAMCDKVPPAVKLLHIHGVAKAFFMTFPGFDTIESGVLDWDDN